MNAQKSLIDITEILVLALNVELRVDDLMSWLGSGVLGSHPHVLSPQLPEPWIATVWHNTTQVHSVKIKRKQVRSLLSTIVLWWAYHLVLYLP